MCKGCLCKLSGSLAHTTDISRHITRSGCIGGGGELGEDYGHFGLKSRLDRGSFMGKKEWIWRKWHR